MGMNLLFGDCLGLIAGKDVSRLTRAIDRAL